jgi:hypothetical protein
MARSRPQRLPPHASQSRREIVGWRLQVVLASLRAFRGGSLIGVSPSGRILRGLLPFCTAANGNVQLVMI